MIIRKNSLCNRSDDGAHTQAVLMSVNRALRLRGQLKIFIHVTPTCALSLQRPDQFNGMVKIIRPSPSFFPFTKQICPHVSRFGAAPFLTM
ncbi:MAG: hypothetical protein H0X11_05080 [Betaproteobacteria bacterium]|nr:hypothetical protein [Betaproteobacteria bacterium]